MDNIKLKMNKKVLLFLPQGFEEYEAGFKNFRAELCFHKSIL
jgi:hypothetical protein